MTDTEYTRSNSAHPETLYRMGRIPGVLKSLGFDSLREGQDTAVANLISGQDTIAILPTGYGKSAIYIVPTLCCKWKTLAFFPLVALMKDQVESLWRMGLKAGQVTSLQTPHENVAVLESWARGDLDFLLVAPERLASEPFRNALRRQPPNQIVIDEAHCVDQWSDTFRPDYVKIGSLISEVNPEVVLALTATMTPDMETSVRRVLHLSDAHRVMYYPERRNLNFSYSVYSDNKLVNALEDIDGPTLVYCPTVKLTHSLYDKFKFRISGGCSVYNSKLSPSEKDTNQTQFMHNNIRVMFATSAFGMGVNKPDIRGVVHVGVSDSIESYIQEAGRAGRDGKGSTCLLLNDEKAYGTREWFVENTYPTESEIRRVWRHISQAAKNDELQHTLAEIAESTHMDLPKVTASIQAMVGAGVVDRTAQTSKVARVRVIRDHPDVDMSHLMKTVESHGYYNSGGNYYAIDLNILSNECGRSLAFIKTSLSGLDKSGHISYSAPFRGKSTIIKGDISMIDFDRLAASRSFAFSKLKDMVDFAPLDNNSKHRFLTEYFK
jgi:ATP-dependent DNA helicase RecQ